MYEKRQKQSMSWKAKIIIFFMTAAIIVMAVVLCVFSVKIKNLDKTNELSPRKSWEKGLIAADGGDVRGTIAIRTKDFIPLNKLSVDICDNSGITYQIFWYDKNKVFISCTEELVVDYDMTQKPELAEYARFMIKPVNDPEVSSSEIQEYASELTVEWSK